MVAAQEQELSVDKSKWVATNKSNAALHAWSHSYKHPRRGDGPPRHRTRPSGNSGESVCGCRRAPLVRPESVIASRDGSCTCTVAVCDLDGLTPTYLVTDLRGAQDVVRDERAVRGDAERSYREDVVQARDQCWKAGRELARTIPARAPRHVSGARTHTAVTCETGHQRK